MATEVLIHVSGSQAEHHAHDGMDIQMISGKLIGSYIWCGHWPRSNFCISCNVACGARPHFTKMSGTYLGFLGTSANPPLKCYFFLGGLKYKDLPFGRIAFNIAVVLQLDWHMRDLETGHQVILVSLMVCEH